MHDNTSVIDDTAIRVEAVGIREYAMLYPLVNAGATTIMDMVSNVYVAHVVVAAAAWFPSRD